MVQVDLDFDLPCYLVDHFAFLVFGQAVDIDFVDDLQGRDETCMEVPGLRKIYLTIYTLPYLPFPISRSFLKSWILIFELELAWGDWHFVESDSLKSFCVPTDICLYDVTSFFFKNKLFEGFQLIFVVLPDWTLPWSF